MKLKIEESSVVGYKNTYEVAIEVEAGNYPLVVGPFYRDADEDALESLLTLLNNLATEQLQKQGSGHSSMYTYNHVPGFEGWFGTSLADTEEQYLEHCWALVPYADNVSQYFFSKRISEHRGNTVFDSWPSNVRSNDGTDALYDSHQVYFYDENGVKRAVSVEP